MRKLLSYIQPAVNDHTSGSGDLLRKLQKGLISLAEDDKELSKEKLQVVIVECLRHLAHFAIIIHFLDRLAANTPEKLVGPFLIGFIQDYNDKWENISYKQANLLLSEQPITGQSIFTHSHSSAIVSLLTDVLSIAKTNQSLIYQTISYPGKEGLIQGSRLEKAGWKIQYVEDADIGKFMPSCDFVLLGSDVIAGSFFINKAGSKLIARAANEIDIPVYVVGDDRKLVNHNKLSKKISAKMLLHKPGIFENVPFDLVAGIILRNEIFSPAQIAKKIESVSYSDAFNLLVSKLR